MKKEKNIYLNTLNIEKKINLFYIYILNRIYFTLYRTNIYYSNFYRKRKKEFLLLLYSLLYNNTIVNYSFDIINHMITNICL